MRDTTVLLVRHAEKELVGNDPPLTAAGLARAQALADAAGDAGVTVIFVSDALRTQQTAAPIAARLGLTPIIVPIGTDPAVQAADIAARIRANHGGSRVLVVGHSNTMPMIIEGLGFNPAPAIGETEFDHFFAVIRRQDAVTRVVRTRYGP